ncbi:hypothetical protein O6P37_18800 [Mycobacterium sp. CPCC 205372]|uniref:Uncharacterized protein n=1 Tax=Mycobacterium hippophais TaxID=3016340 RepID=A0ABT4PWF8_9MYCO|nr:hypothetical protein [Mycobacterium hippophais]MCZ8380920.1 hypothetical protein [Mycobacterium hippophais]
MPLQNRVTPDGDIIATEARGTLMGNRGVLHDADRRIVRRSRNRMWLICLLEFRERRRSVMTPGSYTELFFLDEAVALAAGHRPCAECRRDRYRAFLDAARVGAGRPVAGAKDLDALLAASRRAPRSSALAAELPDGVFVDLGGRDGGRDLRLLWDGATHRWTPAGYVDPAPVSAAAAEVAVVTPALTVAALRHGYRVQVHPTAHRSG